MKIQRKTKIQQGSGILFTSIPNIITEICDIKKGEQITWILEDENEIKIKLENK